VPILASFLLPAHIFIFFSHSPRSDCDTSAFASLFSILALPSSPVGVCYPDVFTRCPDPAPIRSSFSSPADPPFLLTGQRSADLFRGSQPCAATPSMPLAHFKFFSVSSPPPHTSSPRVPLHPLLFAQFASVCPESDDICYVDWLCAPRCPWVRRCCPAGIFPWSVSWAPPHLSWLHCDHSFFRACFDKAAQDRARGIIISSTSPSDPAFAAACSCSFVVFRVLRNSGAVVMWAFASGDFGAVAATTSYVDIPEPCAPLQLPSSRFCSAAWTRALSWFPDRVFVARTVNGIDFGRRFGFLGNRLTTCEYDNNTSYFTHQHVLEGLYADERVKRWRLGPFAQRPLFNLRCNPQGAVTKAFSSKVRPVDDLSAPHDGVSSVNDGTVSAGITHTRVDMFVAAIRRLGRHCVIWKADVTGAYKLVRVALQDIHLLGSHTRLGYDVSAVFPFGGRPSGDIWDDYGTALEFSGRMFARPDVLGRYVDDFVGLTASAAAQPDWARASFSLLAFMHVCDVLGVPMDKFDIGTRVEILGVLLDTDLMLAVLSDERRGHVVALLSDWLSRSVASRSELESLAGLLNWLCFVVPNGRAFLGRVISMLHSTRRTAGTLAVTDAIRQDLRFWHEVLCDKDWKGEALFLDEKWIAADDLALFTDACLLGHGALCGQDWYGAAWTDEVYTLAREARVCDCERHSRDGVSMPFLEAMAVVAAAATWGSRWARRRITFFCDCQPAIDAFNNRYSKSHPLLFAIRSLCFVAHRHNFTFRFRWLSSRANAFADALSRQDFARFHQLCLLQGFSPAHSMASPAAWPRGDYETRR
jgi:hypothetical protein